MIALVRGGGDLASGVALRLQRAGCQVTVTELPQPLVVRRYVAFAEAVFRGRFSVEGVSAQRVATADEARAAMARGEVAVLIDPGAECRHALRPTVIVDARMLKRAPDLGLDAAPLVIGLGPGFVAGENCHAVVETMRGHTLGRVFWSGAAQPDSGLPEAVAARQADRVLRAPADGLLRNRVDIGAHLAQGELVATVGEAEVRAPFKGVLRGLLHDGLPVTQRLKIGDLDPRDDERYCTLVSDKSLAVGGGVLEAVLSRAEIRRMLAG